jgi:hypothetical protein
MVPRPRPHRGRVSFCDRVRTCRRWDCINVRQRERAKEARFAAGTSLLTSPATRRMPPKCGAFPVQSRRSPLRQTACWRKADSNRWSHLRRRRSSEYLISPPRAAHRPKPGLQIAFGRDVSADIGQRLDPEPEEFAVLVERQLGVTDIVAGVLVSLDRLTALAGPFDRPAQLLRSEQHQPMLGILPALGAEPAADIAGNDPDPAFRRS